MINQAEKILIQLDGQKDVSVEKLDHLIGQLNVEFNPNAVKAINEISVCLPVDGVNLNKDEFDFPSESMSMKDKPPLSQPSYRKSSTLASN